MRKLFFQGQFLGAKGPEAGCFRPGTAYLLYTYSPFFSLMP